MIKKFIGKLKEATRKRRGLVKKFMGGESRREVRTVSVDKVITKKSTVKFVTNALVTKKQNREMEDIYAGRIKKLKENVKKIGSVNRALLSTWGSLAKGHEEELESGMSDVSGEERDVLPARTSYYKAATKSPEKVRQSAVVFPTYRDTMNTPKASQRDTPKLSTSTVQTPERDLKVKVGQQIEKMTISKNAMWHKTQTMKKRLKKVQTPFGKMFQALAGTKLEE